MFSHITSVSQSIDLLRRFSTITLAGYEELTARQLDSTDAWINRNCQKLKDGLSQTYPFHPQEEWLKAMQEVLLSSIEAAREDITVASQYQVETGRLIQKQTAELQRLLSDSLSELSEISTAETEKPEKANADPAA